MRWRAALTSGALRSSAFVSLSPGAAALLIVAALAACAPRAPPPDLSLDPGRLLCQVREAAQEISSVRGGARLRTKGRSRLGVPALVAAEKPDRLHLEAHDFFGNPAMLLVTGGGRLAIYDARNRTFYRGAATAENVGRLVPIALSAEDLVAILCGAPALTGEPVRAQPGRGHVELELRDGPRTTVLRVISGAAVGQAAIRVAGGGGYEVSYGKASYSGGGPRDVKLSSEKQRVNVELAWMEDAEKNPPLEESLFRLEPPRGARVVDLGEGDGSGPPPVFDERSNSEAPGPGARAGADRIRLPGSTGALP